MTKKQIFCSIGFLFATCVVLYLLCDLFELKNSTNFARRFSTYRDLNEDTVDAVLIGTSGVDRYWISAKAYEEHGFTAYPLSTGEQPAWLYEYLIEEVYTYQDPELLILDMRPFGQDNVDEVEMDVKARRVLDVIEPLSMYRLKAGLKTMKVMHETFEDKPRFDIAYLLSVVKYHEQWSDDQYSVEKNLFERQHKYLGFYVNKKKSIQKKPQQMVSYDPNYYESLDPVSEQAFYDVVDYLKENHKDKKVLFYLSPKFLTTVEMGRMNTLIDMLEKEGMDYVNFCETDENGEFLYDFGFDLSYDFYDGGHTNFYGADKFTAVFAAYLDEKYDLPDHRDEAAVKEQWDGIYDKIKAKIPELEAEAAAAAAEALQGQAETEPVDEYDEGEEE